MSLFFSCKKEYGIYVPGPKYSEEEINLCSVPPGTTGIWQCIMERHFENGAYQVHQLTPCIKLKFYYNGLVRKYSNCPGLTAPDTTMTWGILRDKRNIINDVRDTLALGDEKRWFTFYSPTIFVRHIPVNGHDYEQTFWKY
jgi:hypothetical protein